MRISTLSIQQQSIRTMLEQQSALVKTQQQISSGERLTKPSDDPVAAQRMLELDAALQRTEQYQTNANLVRVRLNLEENALDSADDVVQRARELVVQASNSTQDVITQRNIANEIRKLSDSLMAIANTQNGEGEYLFAGFQSGTQPFARTAGNVAYFGDQGERRLQVSDSLHLADGHSGSEVFQMIETGNGTFSVEPRGTNNGSGLMLAGGVTDLTSYDGGEYTIEFISSTEFEVRDNTGVVLQTGSYVDGETISFSGLQVSITGTPEPADEFIVRPSSYQDMFATLDAIATALQGGASNDAARAQLRSDLNAGMENLDRVLERLMQVRIDVGNRLSTLDTQERANDEMSLQLESTLSDIRDLDFAEAITRLNLQMTGLQAAQQTYSRVQGLSLFNYL